MNLETSMTVGKLVKHVCDLPTDPADPYDLRFKKFDQQAFERTMRAKANDPAWQKKLGELIFWLSMVD